jgi:hypothetical protein
MLIICDGNFDVKFVSVSMLMLAMVLEMMLMLALVLALVLILEINDGVDSGGAKPNQTTPQLQERATQHSFGCQTCCYVHVAQAAKVLPAVF